MQKSTSAVASALVWILLCAGPAITVAGPRAVATPTAVPHADATPKPQATATPPAPTPGHLGPVVTTAQRHPTPIDATSRQTYIITSADLERVGAMTAADALRFVPGAVVQQYGPYGSLATAALRGASTSQTLVLIDGQPANEGDTGLFDFSSLPAHVIDRVEVVSGGASTLYGSAAMGGVINIITKHPRDPGHADLYAQLGYEGAFARGATLTFGVPDMLARVDLQAITARNSFAYPAFGMLYTAGVRTNTDAKTTDMGIALSGHLGAVVTRASLRNDTSAIGAPGSVFFASDLARQQRVYQRANFDFDLPLTHGDVDFQLASDGRRLHFFDTTQPSPTCAFCFPFDTQANGNSRSASLRTTLELGQRNVLTAGYDTTAAEVTFDQAYVPPGAPAPKTCQGGANFNSCRARAAATAWYLQDEVHAPGAPLTLSFGARNQRSQGTSPVTVPSVGAIVRISSALDVRANYARAFRTPNLDERYFPGYGSPALQPEYGATYDLGLRGHPGRVDYTLALFGQDTSNLIINVPIDSFGDVAPFNVSRSRVRGIESSLKTNVGDYAHVYLAYTDFVSAADLTPGNSGPIRLLYRPTSTGAFSAWIDRATWSYGIDSTYVGRRYADEKNTEVLTPYLVAGFHVQKAINAHWALTVRVDNIGNNHHAEDQLGYPVVGSALSVRLSTQQ